MKYTIRINEVKSEDSHVKGFATVTFADSLLVSHIAIIQKKDSDELFVSMPSYRTNEVTEGILLKLIYTKNRTTWKI